LAARAFSDSVFFTREMESFIVRTDRPEQIVTSALSTRTQQKSHISHVSPGPTPDGAISISHSQSSIGYRPPVFRVEVTMLAATHRGESRCGRATPAQFSENRYWA
jgi:hypothetical protein